MAAFKVERKITEMIPFKLEMNTNFVVWKYYMTCVLVSLNLLMVLWRSWRLAMTTTKSLKRTKTRMMILNMKMRILNMKMRILNLKMMGLQRRQRRESNDKVVMAVIKLHTRPIDSGSGDTMQFLTKFMGETGINL